MESMGALIIGLLAHTLRSDQYYEKVPVGTVEKTKFGSYEMTAECGGEILMTNEFGTAEQSLGLGVEMCGIDDKLGMSCANLRVKLA